MSYPLISVCMIVRNEEENLPRLLASIQGFADEVVVVDTGSTDRTVQIAKDYGAGIHYFEWCDDFSAARNESLRHATKDYIMWLDADDEVPREDHILIKEHLKTHPDQAAYLRVVSVSEDGEAEAMQLRIFPNLEGLAFTGKVHEQIHPSLSEKGVQFTGCEARVRHLGYHTREALQKKLKRNKMIHERDLKENPDDLHSLFFLARALKSLDESEEALQCMEKVLALGDPGNDRVLLIPTINDMAETLCRIGRDEEAVLLLEKWIPHFKDSALLNFSLGEIYFKGGDYKNAYPVLASLKDEKFNREIVPLPVRTLRLNLLRYLGISALFNGEPALAETCFSQSLGMDDKNPETWHYLSLAKEQGADMPGAIEVCRRGLAAIEDKGLLAKRLFLALIKTHEWKDALVTYDGLNGQRDTDLEVIGAMFLMHCLKLDADGINRYYALMRSGLSLPPETFPEGIGPREGNPFPP